MTPKERAAMQQALEALENYGIDGTKSVGGIKCTEALTALREALAEQAKQAEIPEWVDVDDYEEQKQEPVAWRVVSEDGVKLSDWIDGAPSEGQELFEATHGNAVQRAYAAPQPVKQEPVAEIIGFERTNDIRGVKRIPRIKWNVPLWEDESPLQLGNLYAAPVRTKDLTAQEKANIIYAADHRNPMAMIDAAIALYREKNR